MINASRPYSEICCIVGTTLAAVPALGLDPTPMLDNETVAIFCARNFA